MPYEWTPDDYERRRGKPFPRIDADTPTFFGVPLVSSPEELAGADVVIIGAPYAAGWGSYAGLSKAEWRAAPQRVRQQSIRYRSSYLQDFDQEAVKSVITAPGGGVTEVEALVLETLFTAVFLAVILTVTRRMARQAAFAIPATLVVIHLALVPFTGSSVNPARSIGPALVGGDTTSLWIYLVGPIVGGLLGWAVYRVFTPPETAAD